ncbi:protein of unknown function (plasmid) [Xenorhabdus doucetiae]|uniref:Uncharacterized protein n=1 Tax=Xenorhabdus doucetiae TaxID=351671 RepID=A0A068QLW0_9GAMM|nr:protein of unknown function [Xenorhabdus doucetiae]
MLATTVMLNTWAFFALSLDGALYILYCIYKNVFLYETRN